MIRRILKLFLYYKIEKYPTVPVRDAHQKPNGEDMIPGLDTNGISLL